MTRLVGFPIAAGDLDEQGLPEYCLVEVRRRSSGMDYSLDQDSRLFLKAGSGLERARDTLPMKGRGYSIRSFPPFAPIPRISSEGLTDRVVGYRGTSDYGAAMVARLRSAPMRDSAARTTSALESSTCVLISIAHDRSFDFPSFGRISKDTSADSAPDSVEVASNMVQLLHKWRAAHAAYRNHGSAVLVLLHEDAAELVRSIERFPDEFFASIVEDGRRVGFSTEWDGSTPDVHFLVDVEEVVERAKGPVLVGIDRTEIDALVAFVDDRDEIEGLPTRTDTPMQVSEGRWAAYLVRLVEWVQAKEGRRSLVVFAFNGVLVAVLAIVLLCFRSANEQPHHYLHVVFPPNAPGGKPWDESFLPCKPFVEPDIAVVLDNTIIGAAECKNSYECYVPIYQSMSPPPWNVFIQELDDCAGGAYSEGGPCEEEVVLRTDVGFSRREVEGFELQIVSAPAPRSERVRKEEARKQDCLAAHGDGLKKELRALFNSPASLIRWLPTPAALFIILLVLPGVLGLLLLVLTAIDHTLTKQLKIKTITLSNDWGDYAAAWLRAYIRMARKFGYDIDDERALQFRSLVRSTFDTTTQPARLAEPLALFENGLFVLENAEDAIDKGGARPKWQFYTSQSIAGVRFVDSLLFGVYAPAALWPILFVFLVGWQIPWVQLSGWWWLGLIAPALGLLALGVVLRLSKTKCRFELVSGKELVVSVPYHSDTDRAVLLEWFSKVKSRRNSGS